MIAPIPAMFCETCDDTGWVCEGHGNRPWEGTSNRADACHCGPGKPCPDCTPAGMIPHPSRYVGEVICGSIPGWSPYDA